MRKPSDYIEHVKRSLLTDRDRRRLVSLRDQSEIGAVQIRFTVSVRAAVSKGERRAWRPLRGAQQIYSAHSALNAEQIILGGPLAGRQFHATTELLELYEQNHRRKKD